MNTTLEILDRLIAFDTTSTHSNLDLMSYAEDLLRGFGFRMTRLPSPNGQKSGLYAEIGPQTDGGILLSAHTDVVPATGQNWSRPPFRLTTEGERLFGRGTTDMKGFVASALALGSQAATAKLSQPLKIVLSYDEEIGCVGIAEMRDRLAPLIGTPDLCIVGEPTNMAIAIGHKGKAALRAEFQGQAGHSALAPNFVNALHLAGDFMGELRALQYDLKRNGPKDQDYDVPFTTVHVAKLTGGSALNIVPDSAEMMFEIRYLDRASPEAIFDQIANAAKKVEGNYSESKVTIEVTNRYPGLASDPDSPAVTHLKRLTNAPVTKVAFGTEGGTFAELGHPTLVCGPGSMEGQGHKADEFITRSQLRECDAMLGKILGDISIA